MVKQRLLSLAAATIALSGLTEAARADDGVFGFNYCPPPVVPSCIERSAGVRGRHELDACSRDVLRFTQTLGAYRICLIRESERAVGTGNDAIARFRCLSQHIGSCESDGGPRLRKGNGNSLRSN